MKRTDLEASPPSPRHTAAVLARWSLSAFLITFVVARGLVFLIMTRRLPDLYLFIGQTHVHHLNYGIFLLTAVGGILLFWPPHGRAVTALAVAYGIGLALTFDEFGMWLHLEDEYWQRASYDAVGVVAALLGLIVVAPRLRQFRARHWIVAAAVVLAALVFAWILLESMRRMHGRG